MSRPPGPYKINYQGVLKDDNRVKVDGTVDIDLRLLPLGGGDARYAGAAGTAGEVGAQGPQGKQGDTGPVGSGFWDGDLAGDIYKVNSSTVGISTTTPTSLLHISGSEPSAIRMSGTRPGYGPRDYLFGLQAGNLSTGDPGMRLQTVDATAGLIRTILDAQGFFGIGDLTPAVRLHVNESPNGAGELGRLLRITGYEPRMEIEATRNGTTWTIGGNMSGLDDNGMRLVIGNNHMGTAMAINQVGRVGIGVETPVAKLHVMEMPENSGDQGLLFRITGREPRMELEALRTGVTWSIAANYTGGDHGMRLRIANSDSGPALTINQPGRVGIGTDVPSAKLDVVGQVKISGGNPGAGKVLTSDADGLATWESPGAGSQGPQGKQGPAGADGVQGPAGPVGSEFWDTNVDGDLYSTAGAKVGIGTTEPGAGNPYGYSAPILEVNGTDPSLRVKSGSNYATIGLGTEVMQIGTNGNTTQLTVHHNGSIGIGTGEPASVPGFPKTLHIRNTVGPWGDVSIRLENDLGNNLEIGMSGNEIQFYFNSTKVMSIDESGNLSVKGTVTGNAF